MVDACPWKFHWKGEGRCEVDLTIPDTALSRVTLQLLLWE